MLFLPLNGLAGPQTHSTALGESNLSAVQSPSLSLFDSITPGNKAKLEVYTEDGRFAFTIKVAPVLKGVMERTKIDMIRTVTGTGSNLLLELSVPEGATGGRFTPNRLFLELEGGKKYSLGKMFELSFQEEGNSLISGSLFRCFLGECRELTEGDSYTGVYSFYRKSSLSRVTRLANLFADRSNLTPAAIYIYYRGGGQRVKIPKTGEITSTEQPSISRAIELPQTGSQNVGEHVQVSESVEPGDVVGMDPDRPNHYRKTREPYSTFVAGVITVRPVVELGMSGKAAEGPVLALSGTAKVKVTTENGPVGPGDLLTTSSTPGYAMVCRDKARCSGAIIGKALQPLDSGKGRIEVLLVG